MSKPKEPQRPCNPRVPANASAVAALCLVYLFYQLAKPYLTRGPYGPSTFQFVLGLTVVGGGAAILGFLAWKMFKAPLPEEEAPALPEEAEAED